MTTFTDPFASSTEIPVVEVMAFDRSLELRLRVRHVLGSGERSKHARDSLTRAIGDVMGAAACAFVLYGRQGPQYAGGTVAKHRVTVATSTWREPQPAERAWFAASARLPGSALPAPTSAPWGAALITPIHDGAAALVGALILARPAPGFTAEDERLLATIAPDLAAVCARPPRRVPLAVTHAPQTAQQNAALALFQATDEAAVVIDERFVVRAWNPAFATLTGQRRALTGHSCKDLLRCSDAQGIPLCGTTLCPLFAAQATLPAASGANSSVAIAQPNGTKRQITARAVALPAPGAKQDRLMLLSVAQANASPPAPPDAFLGDVAHKLRNHLNSIHGFVELVANGHAGPIAPRQSELLSYAHASSIELMEYIENLLLLTRSEVGYAGLNLDTVHPHDLLEEAAQYLELEATAAQVHLRCAAPATLPPVVGDHLRLRQAVMNLISNAIKYTEPHGTIRLAATALPAALELTVTDSGIGIAPEDIQNIFTRGYQSQRTGRLGKNGGGLGLAATQVIITQHGGTLTCASTVGRGATFTIRLPRAP